MQNPNGIKAVLIGALLVMGFACGKKDESSDVNSKRTVSQTVTVTPDNAMDGKRVRTVVSEDGTDTEFTDKWYDPNDPKSGEVLSGYNACEKKESYTGRDSEGRSWGYENGMSCKIVE